MSEGKINRRRALLTFGLAGLAPAVGGAGIAGIEGVHFAHGVASGDPLHDRLIIWTRLSGADRATEVIWQVAEDEEFGRIVQTGRFITDQSRDYTVKVDVGGLVAGQVYFYRFESAGQTSPVGQAKTLPENTDRLVLAVASCSLHPNGYFNAYQAIAELKEVDAVVHLGDYIYEYGAGLNDYGMANGQLLGRIPEPPHEIVSLQDYRQRHAQYKREPELQAAHGRAAWICVFDDHEICNNPWVGGAQNHNPEKGEGDYFTRKAAALKAHREWMPIRDAEAGQLSETIYRRFRFGKLAELFMLETRLVARTEQLDYPDDIPFQVGEDDQKIPDYDALRVLINAPERELLGEAQRQWLDQGIEASVAHEVTWQVLGNQIIMARVAGPDVRRIYGEPAVTGLLNRLPAKARAVVEPMVELFSQEPALPLNLDAWDGYPAERERLYDILKRHRARTVVLSGDSHSAWANQLHDAAGTPVAVELGVTAISSPTVWFDALVPGFNLAQTLTDQNAEVLAASTAHNGFVRLTLTPQKALGEWMSVSGIGSRDFRLFTEQAFEAQAEADGIGPLKGV
ncbi:MAG: alkaline phosphatase D family protein [Asticcacaulis sp.]